MLDKFKGRSDETSRNQDVYRDQGKICTPPGHYRLLGGVGSWKKIRKWETDASPKPDLGSPRLRLHSGLLSTVWQRFWMDFGGGRGLFALVNVSYRHLSDYG